ncbi:unnamed protein product [Rotaria sp. Silwood2]|nr:unnamed protein product [Rotaria sp. Silwood2]
MNNRVRTQKKIYTPTTTTNEPDCYLCKIIETGECIIVNRSSMKRVYDDTAEIMVYGRRMEATILIVLDILLFVAQVLVKNVEMYAKKKERTVNSNNFDEPNNSQDEENANDDDDEPIDLLKSLSNDDRSSDEENDNAFLTPSSTHSLIKHMDIQFNSIPQENDKQFLQLSKKIDHKHTFDSIDLSSFRESGQHEKFGDVMHGNINLSRIRGRNIGDYARQALGAIFSHEELLSSILPPGGHQYVRKPLDNAVRGKYEIGASYYNEFYAKLVRPKLVDFLADERKRDRRSTSTQSSTSMS